MKPAVVVTRDVAPDGSRHRPVVAKVTSMDLIGFEGMEEGFHMGVVGHLARAVHALGEAELGKPLAEGVPGVLDSAVAVEDDPGTGSSVEHCAIQGRERE